MAFFSVLFRIKNVVVALLVFFVVVVVVVGVIVVAVHFAGVLSLVACNCYQLFESH